MKRKFISDDCDDEPPQPIKKRCSLSQWNVEPEITADTPDSIADETPNKLESSAVIQHDSSTCTIMSGKEKQKESDIDGDDGEDSDSEDSDSERDDVNRDADTGEDANIVDIHKDKINGEPSNTLFVKNLPYTFDESDILDIFPAAIEIRLPRNNHENRGFAFIDFKTVEALGQALVCRQGLVVDGRRLFIKQNNEDKEYQNTSIQRERGLTKVLLVKNAGQTTKTKLRNFLGSEDIVKITLPRYPVTRKKIGNALVEFVSCQAALKAFDKCNGKAMHDHPLHIQFTAEKRSKCDQHSNKLTESDLTNRQVLCVRNFSSQSTEGSMKKALGADVQKVVFRTYVDSGVENRFAFVEFSSLESAAKAMEKYNGKPLDGCRLEMDFAMNTDMPVTKRKHSSQINVHRRRGKKRGGRPTRPSRLKNTRCNSTDIKQAQHGK